MPGFSLGDAWRVAAESRIAGSAAEISIAGFEDEAWTPTQVPSTVLAALVQSDEIRDPYFDRELERIPTEQFEEPWWYRTEFALDGPLPPGARLIFEGINYRADIWLNGQQIASGDQIFGAFRMFDLGVAKHLVEGENALAVRVHPPRPGDPTIGFVDWNPRPPDRNMGLWRGVHLQFHQGIGLRDVFVRSDLDPDTLGTADLGLRATVSNESDRPVKVLLRGTIDGSTPFEHPVELEAGETREIEVTSAGHPELRLENPRLWWPNNMGEPELHDLHLEVATEDGVSDSQRVTFGIRHIEDYLTEEGYRGYRINGKPLLIRGGGWVDELMLADTDRRIEDQILYAKHMNLNTIRLEGFWGSSQRLFDLADEHGILVMVGWSCQWEWEDYLEGPVDEYGGIDTPEEIDLVARSLRDQVLWLRNHPSVFVWVLASDMLPRPELERRYLDELAKIDTSRPTLAACATDVSEVSGPSGVKMNGPYDWVPPIYWFIDTEHGGAYGFNTETGPGPQPPPLASLQRMLPAEHWWPVGEMWNFHSGRNQFQTIENYHAALDARYGEASDLEDFARKAQLANYEGMRAMFEAFSIRRPKTTGLIQWMLNSAWPELYWQLYDYYLVPNGAFYGARDAARPINIAFDRADRSIVAVNDTAAPVEGVSARVRVLDFGSEVLFDELLEIELPAESIERLLELPPVSAEGGAYFLDLRLTDSGGETLATSLYWLSTVDDELDWEASEWYYTPTTRYADFTGLGGLPEVTLEVDHRFEDNSGGQTVHVILENPSDKLAFFVELSVVDAHSGQLLAPILWSENYVSLLPGERREVSARIPAHALGDQTPVLQYQGINVAAGP